MKQYYKEYVKYQRQNYINIDFSNKCILQCVMCQRQFVHNSVEVGKIKVKKSSDIVFDDFQKILRVYSSISLCGQISDPIYHPYFLKYLRYASNNNIKININTNGSGKKKQFWKDAFSIVSPIRWVFGIDGLDQKTVNLHRIGQNFHQSFKAMILGSQTHHRIVWQFIPFQHNEHQIERAKDIARKHNIEFMILKSNRWSHRKIVINNKHVTPDWILPPADRSLTSQYSSHAKKVYM